MALVLNKKCGVTGNSLSVCDKTLYIITGANQGGKSTFLRSVGQAQLMMQCGLFAGAEAFEAPLRSGVFTHFKKEEDTKMKSGKLDEELARMDEIAAHISPFSLLLFNESFASTNEREGSEICRQVTQALVENEIEVFSVTHLYPYAVSYLEKKERWVQYLTAQRLEDGTRSFQVVPGLPLKTAYGEDLYQKIFHTQNDESV